MMLRAAIQNARRRAKSTGVTQYVLHIPDPDRDGSEYQKFSYFVADLGEIENWFHATDREIVFSTED